MRMSKKGNFIGWFLFIIVIIFIVLPLIIGAVKNLDAKNIGIIRGAESKCNELIPTETLENVLCKSFQFGTNGKQTMPLLFVLLTFIVVTIILYGLIEEVPPFKNQIKRDKKGPAIVFTLLISSLVVFFTDTTKYLVILLVFSGSIVLYTVVALFLVFIFLRLGLHGHKEGINLKKDYYKDLASDKKMIRESQLEAKEVTRDIKTSKSILKELKRIDLNDEQEIKPLEKLKEVLTNLEKIIQNLAVIKSESERITAFTEIKKYIPGIKKLIKKIQREFGDETEYQQKLVRLENLLGKEFRDTKRAFDETSEDIMKRIEKTRMSKDQKERLREQVRKAQREVNTIINTFDQEYKITKQRLEDEFNQQSSEIKSIITEVESLFDRLTHSEIPSNEHISRIIDRITHLEALIEHKDKVLLPEIMKLEKKVDSELHEITAQIESLGKLLEQEEKSEKKVK
ncbi:MAG: hypothetical protein PWR32_491 [Candidatus Woesearchaeota archaeon]|nr:hypothetical protein [Candidatus Woesearchaeota archaeon]